MSVQEADYGMTDLAFQGAQGRYIGDDTLLVKFFTHPRLNQPKSKLAERPIYQDTPYIQIMQPGNKDSIVIRPATERDKHRFAEHFRKYEARESQDHIEGTLLSEWPGLTRSQCEELRYLNVRTVEQLAAITDVNAQNVMGIAMLRTKATKYLEDSAKTHLADDLHEKDLQIELLKKRLDEIDAKSAKKTAKAVKPETVEA